MPTSIEADGSVDAPEAKTWLYAPVAAPPDSVAPEGVAFDAGLDPAVIDFSTPFFADKPWINAEVIHAGLARDKAALAAHRHETDLCMIDMGETAEAVTAAALAEAGSRTRARPRATRWR